MTDHITKVDKDEEETIVEKKTYHVYETVVTAKTIHFYLSDEVNDPINYIDMIHKIRTSTSSDIIYIHLNTPGGRLDTGVQLINAFRASQAKIITVLEAEAHSLGTLLFLAGDEFIVQDNCLMMIHNFSSGTWGKGNEQRLQLDATIKWFNKLAKDIYIPFLTEGELNQVINGRDMWMDSDEITKRLKNMVKVLTEEAANPKRKKSKKKTTKKKS